MGQTASTVRQEAEASAKKGMKQESARIDLLEEMGRRLIQQFEEGIRLETKDPFEFDLGRIITQASAIRLLSSETTDNLKTFARGLVEDIAKGDIADAICSVVNEGIDALLASSFGCISEKRLYTVKLGTISVQRLDIYMYQYDLTVSGLISTHQKLFVYAYAISTLQHVTPNLLRSVIDLSLPKAKSREDSTKNALKLYHELAPVLLSERKAAEEDSDRLHEPSERKQTRE